MKTNIKSVLADVYTFILQLRFVLKLRQLKLWSFFITLEHFCNFGIVRKLENYYFIIKTGLCQLPRCPRTITILVPSENFVGHFKPSLLHLYIT